MAGSETFNKDHENVLKHLEELKSNLLPLIVKSQEEQKRLGETHFKTADKISNLEAKFEGEITTELKQARADLADLKKASDAQKSIIDEMRMQAQRPSYAADDRPRNETFGQQFVQSKNWESLVEHKGKREALRGVSPYTLDKYESYLAEQKSGITGTSFTSLRDIFTVDRLDTIYADPLRPERVRDAFPIIPTKANSVEYWVQTSMINNAATVAESPDFGAPNNKPVSEFEGEIRTANLRILAHLLITSQQLLEDAPAFAAHIDQYMRWGLDEKEDTQLLIGSGAGSDILGLLNVPGIQSLLWSTGVATDTRLDAIMRGMTLVREAYYPTDYCMTTPAIEDQLCRTKGTDGHYIWGVQAFQNKTLTLRGVPVIATTAMPANKVALGAFRMSTGLLDRMSTMLAVSDSHANIFAQNMIAWRYEKRIGLMVPRPRGICVVTLDNQPTS